MEAGVSARCVTEPVNRPSGYVVRDYRMYIEINGKSRQISRVRLWLFSGNEAKRDLHQYIRSCHLTAKESHLQQ